MTAHPRDREKPTYRDGMNAGFWLGVFVASCAWPVGFALVYRLSEHINIGWTP